MIARADFIAAVESLAGTPVVHRGRVAGPRGGVDCVGVVLVALAMCGVNLLEVEPYGLVPDADQLTAALSRYCDRVEVRDARPGDVLQVAVGARPRHVQVLVDSRHVVHAWAKGRIVRRVRWEPRETIQAWRLRGVA
jgi:cell wall-associated NlpC family hydrolase